MKPFASHFCSYYVIKEALLFYLCQLLHSWRFLATYGDISVERKEEKPEHLTMFERQWEAHCWVTVEWPLLSEFELCWLNLGAELTTLRPCYGHPTTAMTAVLVYCDSEAIAPNYCLFIHCWSVCVCSVTFLCVRAWWLCLWLTCGHVCRYL